MNSIICREEEVAAERSCHHVRRCRSLEGAGYILGWSVLLLFFGMKTVHLIIFLIVICKYFKSYTALGILLVGTWYLNTIII